MKETHWVLLRDGRVTNIFEDRHQAVKHLKEVLKQTLKDYNKQDITNEYDYEIFFPKIEIRKVTERSSYLGL